MSFGTGIGIPPTTGAAVSIFNGGTGVGGGSGGGGAGGPTGPLTVTAVGPPYVGIVGIPGQQNTVTSATFTPPNASLIVAFASNSDQPSQVFTDSLGLVWTNLISVAAQGTNAFAQIYVTYVPVGSPMYLMNTGSLCVCVGAICLTGAAISQAGGATNTGGTGVGAPNLTTATNFAGSLIVGCGHSNSYRVAPTALANTNVAPNGNNLFTLQTNPFSTGAVSWGFVSRGTIANVLATTGPWGSSNILNEAIVVAEIQKA